MPIKFQPVYTLSPQAVKDLMRIEAAKERVSLLPLSCSVLTSLRETARLYTTHCSTFIEGNQLRPEEVQSVLHLEGHFPGRERDEAEVKGYYAALSKVEHYAAQKEGLSERMVQTLHALVMAEGRTLVKPSPYRDGQNVIRDSRSGGIVYMPPVAKDVPGLMRQLVRWIKDSVDLPCPLVAAIAHYQFATIHPYYDGNGRTARLLTTLILHLGGYDLKGLYSLEEYYAKHLLAYYQAISVGPSHNYYLGRAESDITGWIEYFIAGMALAFEKVTDQILLAQNKGEKDHTLFLRQLDPKQRKALELFRNYALVTSQQVGNMFGFKPRTSSALCKKWVELGFLEVADKGLKSRKYRLAQRFQVLLEE